MSVTRFLMHPFKARLPSIAKDAIAQPVGVKGDMAWTQRGWAL